MKGGGGGMVPVGCRVTSDSHLREGGEGGDGDDEGHGGGGGTMSPPTRVCVREVMVVVLLACESQ